MNSHELTMYILSVLFFTVSAVSRVNMWLYPMGSNLPHKIIQSAVGSYYKPLPCKHTNSNSISSTHTHTRTHTQTFLYKHSCSHIYKNTNIHLPKINIFKRKRTLCTHFPPITSSDDVGNTCCWNTGIIYLKTDYFVQCSVEFYKSWI